jgi:hypothetical protein
MIAETAQNISDDARAVRVAARAPVRVIPLVKTLLAVADIGLITISFLAAFYLRLSRAVVFQKGIGLIFQSGVLPPYGGHHCRIVIRFDCCFSVITISIACAASSRVVEDVGRVFKATANRVAPDCRRYLHVSRRRVLIALFHIPA